MNESFSSPEIDAAITADNKFSSITQDDSLTTESFSLPPTSTAQVNRALTEELLGVAPLVRCVVRRNLSGSHHRQAAEDVEQLVLLSLWQWRGRNSEQKLTRIEMEKIAARSAKRGALGYYRQQMRNTTDPQVDFDNDDLNDTRNHRNETVFFGKSVSIAGGTEAEAASLGRFLLQTIEKLSLRQRFALLLQKNDLIVHLLAARACRTREIAEILGLTRTELLNVMRCLPLSDEQIGELWEEKTGEQITAKQVWEARGKARAKIKQALE